MFLLFRRIASGKHEGQRSLSFARECLAELEKLLLSTLYFGTESFVLVTGSMVSKVRA